MGISEKGIRNMRAIELRPMSLPWIVYSSVMANILLLRIGAKSIIFVSCHTAKLVLLISKSEYRELFSRGSVLPLLTSPMNKLIPYHVIEWRVFKFILTTNI